MANIIVKRYGMQASCQGYRFQLWWIESYEPFHVTYIEQWLKRNVSGCYFTYVCDHTSYNFKVVGCLVIFRNSQVYYYGQVIDNFLCIFSVNHNLNW